MITYNNDTLEPNRVEYYSASWCGPCKQLKPLMEKISKENPSLQILCIDVDENSDKSTGIKSVPTIKMFKDNQLKKTLVGLQSKATYDLGIKELI